VEHAATWAAHRPWLALLLPAGLVLYVAGRNMVASWRHRHHAVDARLVTVAPPPQVDPASAAALWANLAGILTPSRRRRLVYGNPHVVFQYVWSGRRLLISIWVPGTVPHGAVEAAVRGAWPGATVTTDQPAPDPIPDNVDAQTGGHLLPTAAEWLPLRTDHDADPLLGVTDLEDGRVIEGAAVSGCEKAPPGGCGRGFGGRGVAVILRLTRGGRRSR
jgi:hypothetical protein